MGPLRQESLLEVCANQVDEVFSKFRSNLLLDPVYQVKPDVILEHLAHQSVDASAHRGQQHELISAVFINPKRALHSIQLAAQLTHTLQQFQFFSIVVGHEESLFLRTNPR